MKRCGIQKGYPHWNFSTRGYSINWSLYFYSSLIFRRLVSKGFPYIKNIVVDDASPADDYRHDYSHLAANEDEEFNPSASSSTKAPKISRRLWQFILQRSIQSPAVKNLAAGPRKGSTDGVVPGKVPVPTSSVAGAASPIAMATEKTWSQLTKTDLEQIVKEITCSGHLIEGRGEYRDEFVTCGGVDLKEVQCLSL